MIKMLKKDQQKINTLNLIHKELLELLETERNYIAYLFGHFQQDKYYNTNFFKENTLENEIFNFLDEIDINYKKYLLPFYNLNEKLNKFIGKFYEEYCNKIIKEQNNGKQRKSKTK